MPVLTYTLSLSKTKSDGYIYRKNCLKPSFITFFINIFQDHQSIYMVKKVLELSIFYKTLKNKKIK